MWKRSSRRLGGHPKPANDKARDIDSDGVVSVGMSNVLSAEKREQIVALRRLGWSLRRIEQTTGGRRETASGYLRAAGVAVRPSGGWGRLRAKQANGVTTDPDGGTPAGRAVGDSGTSNLANEVTTDPEAENRVLDGLTIPAPPRSSSSAELYREIIEPALMRGRNAMAIWQDLVSDHGFGGSYEAVKRFVRKLRGVRSDTSFRRDREKIMQSTALW